MFGKPVVLLSGLLIVLCYLIMIADGSTYCYCGTEPPPEGTVIIEVRPGPTPIPPVDDPQ